MTVHRESENTDAFVNILDGRLQAVKDYRLRPTVCNDQISHLDLDTSSIGGIKSIRSTDGDSISPSTRRMALEHLETQYTATLTADRSEAAQYAEAYRNGEVILAQPCTTPESPQAVPLPRSPTESILTVSSNGDWIQHAFADPAHAPRSGSLGSYVSPAMNVRSEDKAPSSDTGIPQSSSSPISCHPSTTPRTSRTDAVASRTLFERILAAAQPSKQPFVLRTSTPCERPHLLASVRGRQLLV